MDLLAREDAPLTEQEWGRIDEAVSKAARANLVGRRFLSLHGPLGLGSQVTWVDALEGVSPGAVGAPGEDDPVAPGRRRLLTLDLVSKDFTLMWRDVLNAQGQQLPLDVAAAFAAASMLARAEDNLIFYGTDANPGLINVEGHATVSLAAGLDKPGSGLAAISEARGALVSAGALGPYALVLAPDLYTKLLRIPGSGGRLELELAQSVADAGLFQSSVLNAGTGVLVSTGPEVVDLAVGGDIQVAFLGADDMNLPFRILETLALRIRRPEGICVLA